MSVCIYSPESAKSWVMKYIMTIIITSETIFWSLFIGFQYLSSFGVGTVMFDLSNEHAKMSMIMIIWAYITHSGYYVSVDSVFFNPIFKYG